MSKILKFQNENEESCLCHYCQIREEYIPYITSANDLEELNEIVNELIQEVKLLTQHEVLEQQIVSNIEYLKHLDGECEDECDFE